VELLNKSPTAAELLTRVDNGLRRMGMDPDLARAFICDRAAVMTKLCSILSATICPGIIKVDCTSHTSNNVGLAAKATTLKKYLLEVCFKFCGLTIYLCRFQAAIATMFMHNGSLAHSIFQRVVGQPKVGGGENRWFNVYEWYQQLHDIGIDTFYTVVEACHERKCSQDSVASLLEMRGLFFLQQLDVELCVMTEFGRKVCQATYLFEMDGPTIFVSHFIFAMFECIFFTYLSIVIIN
jgi:hypothetical protein